MNAWGRVIKFKYSDVALVLRRAGLERSSDKLKSRAGTLRRVRSPYPLLNFREQIIIILQLHNLYAPDTCEHARCCKNPNSLFDVCEAVAASGKHLRWGHFSLISTAQKIVFMSLFNKALYKCGTRMIDDSFVENPPPPHPINTERKWHSLHSKAAALLSFNSTHLIWHNYSRRRDGAGRPPILHIAPMISSGFIVALCIIPGDLRPCISRNTHPREIHCFFFFLSCLHHKRTIRRFDEIAKRPCTAGCGG